jgi:predicted RNA-binding protein with PIN domain
VSYLIDGHNLIPKISGLSLRQMDDEARLVELLQVFCRVRRKGVEVFFDGAEPTLSGRKTVGMVVVHNVRKGRTADESIKRRLDQLGNAARNFTVVTSDRQVQGEARIRYAAVMPSETFAMELQAALNASPPSAASEPASMSEQELDDWLKLFGQK